MYRGQLFKDDLVKCHKEKEIMDLGDLATGRSRNQLSSDLVNWCNQGWSFVRLRMRDFELWGPRFLDLDLLDIARTNPSCASPWLSMSLPLTCWEQASLTMSAVSSTLRAHDCMHSKKSAISLSLKVLLFQP